jgi:hypothetical protein
MFNEVGYLTKISLRRQKEGKISLLLVIIVVVVIVAVVAAILLSGAISQNNQVRIRVSYTGNWSGAYGDSGSLNTWSGTGERTVVIDRPSGGGTWTVVANGVKMDASSAVLTVTIETMGGKVLKQATGNTPFGIVQCSVDVG